MRAEVDILKDELAASKITPARYAGPIESIEAALTVRSLAASWSNFQGYLNDGTITALGLFSEFIRDDESAVEEEGLGEIWGAIETLRERLEHAADFSETVRDYLLRQLAILERAIRDYRIRGAAAFQDASLLAFEISRKPVVETAEEAEQVREVEGLWGRLAKIAKRAVIFHVVLATILDDANKAIDFTQKIGLLPVTPAAVQEPAPASSDPPVQGSDKAPQKKNR